MHVEKYVWRMREEVRHGWLVKTDFLFYAMDVELLEEVGKVSDSSC
jgi:hypothetical protein